MIAEQIQRNRLIFNNLFHIKSHDPLLLLYSYLAEHGIVLRKGGKAEKMLG